MYVCSKYSKMSDIFMIDAVQKFEETGSVENHGRAQTEILGQVDISPTMSHRTSRKLTGVFYE